MLGQRSSTARGTRKSRREALNGPHNHTTTTHWQTKHIDTPLLTNTSSQNTQQESGPWGSEQLRERSDGRTAGDTDVVHRTRRQTRKQDKQTEQVSAAQRTHPPAYTRVSTAFNALTPHPNKHKGQAGR